MKSKQDIIPAPVAGLLPAFSQEKTRVWHWQAGRTTITAKTIAVCTSRIAVQRRTWQCSRRGPAVWEMPPLFCQTVDIATMLEREEVVRQGWVGAQGWFGREWMRHGDGVLASSLLRAELIFLPCWEILAYAEVPAFSLGLHWKDKILASKGKGGRK